MHWVLDQLRKYSLFANLKKCCFYQDKVCFLEYIVSSESITIEAEQIKVVKKWPELKSVRDIHVFLGFANFYCRFIKGFSKIAAPLTLRLKTTMSSQVFAANKMLSVRVLAATDVGSASDGSDGSSDGSKRVEPKTGRSESQKLSKSGNSEGKKSAKSKKPSKSGNSPNFDAKEAGPSFLTPEARSAFNRLRLAFTEAPILRHFDPECHIRIETDASGYAIGGVLSQLASETSFDEVVTKADLGQWHPIVIFSRKIIPAETQYKTHNGELLAIIEAFKTWRHYLKGCKHEVLVLTDHNNLCCFMDTKSLSSR